MPYFLFLAMLVVLVVAAVKSDNKSREALDSYNYLESDKYYNQSLFLGVMAVVVIAAAIYYHYITNR